MLDLKWVRENRELAEELLKSRDPKLSLDEFFKADHERRESIKKVEALRADQKRLGKELAKQKKAKETSATPKNTDDAPKK